MPASIRSEQLQFEPSPGKGSVSAVFQRPAEAKALLVLGHGAGSTLAHPLIEGLSEALLGSAVASLRFNYPYSERGRGMDPEPVRLDTVARAVALGASLAPELPLFAGGHSMSGRMTSLSHVRSPLPGVLGVIFYAFPLHAGAPEARRAEHLAKLALPMLFLSGTRDKMAETDLLRRVVSGLERATLELIEAADHSFKVPKRHAGAVPVLAQLAQRTRSWIDHVCASR